MAYTIYRLALFISKSKPVMLCWMKLCSSDNHYTMAPNGLTDFINGNNKDSQMKHCSCLRYTIFCRCCFYNLQTRKNSWKLTTIKQPSILADSYNLQTWDKLHALLMHLTIHFSLLCWDNAIIWKKNHSRDKGFLICKSKILVMKTSCLAGTE